MKKYSTIPVILIILFLLFTQGCAKKEAESLEENKALVRRVIEEVRHQGKLDVVDEVYATNFVPHLVGNPDIRDIEGFKQLVTTLRTAFPDGHFTIDDIIAEGDKVVTRWTFTGTHKGELMGIPPTDKQATVTGIDIIRIASGKIVEGWTNMDTLGFMQQLGVIPPMGQGEE